MMPIPKAIRTIEAGAYLFFRSVRTITTPSAASSHELALRRNASVASMMPRVTWMPITTGVGVLRAIHVITPVPASSIHTMPMLSPDACTIDGDQCCAMATTASAFIGSMGIGRR